MNWCCVSCCRWPDDGLRSWGVSDRRDRPLSRCHRGSRQDGPQRFGVAGGDGAGAAGTRYGTPGGAGRDAPSVLRADAQQRTGAHLGDRAVRTAFRRALLIAALALALVGCQMSHEADADPDEFMLGQEFVLGGGQEAAFSGNDLSVRFSELLEDSRCPTEVECFWTGQARIAVIVQPTGRPSTTAYFNTNPAPGENVQTVRCRRLLRRVEIARPVSAHARRSDRASRTTGRRCSWVAKPARSRRARRRARRGRRR